MSTVEEVFGPVIYSYSREQAIRDGVLVDVSSMAKEAGIVFPVAVTQRVWSEYIVPDDRRSYSPEGARPSAARTSLRSRNARSTTVCISS